MDAPLVSDERNRDQNKHHDEDDALFVFGKLKNPEPALHFILVQLVICLELRSAATISSRGCHVERGETSLFSRWRVGSCNQKFFVSPESQEELRFIFSRNESGLLFRLRENL